MYKDFAIFIKLNVSVLKSSILICFYLKMSIESVELLAITVWP